LNCLVNDCHSNEKATLLNETNTWLAADANGTHRITLTAVKGVIFGDQSIIAFFTVVKTTLNFRSDSQINASLSLRTLVLSGNLQRNENAMTFGED
jgi:hypothetical protein